MYDYEVCTMLMIDCYNISLCCFSNSSMAAFRKYTTFNRTLFPSSLIPPSPFLLTFRRGIAFKLFVGGLSYITTEKGLSDAFSNYGQVVEAKVVTDRVSEKSKGFGFVTFASQDEAENAMTDMNGKALNGRVIFVDYAKLTTKNGGGSGMPIARGPPEPTPEPAAADS